MITCAFQFAFVVHFTYNISLMNDGMKRTKCRKKYVYIYFLIFCLFAISESPDSLK